MLNLYFKPILQRGLINTRYIHTEKHSPFLAATPPHFAICRRTHYDTKFTCIEELKTRCPFLLLFVNTKSWIASVTATWRGGTGDPHWNGLIWGIFVWNVGYQQPRYQLHRVQNISQMNVVADSIKRDLFLEKGTLARTGTMPTALTSKTAFLRLPLQRHTSHEQALWHWWLSPCTLQPVSCSAPGRGSGTETTAQSSACVSHLMYWGALKKPQVWYRL